MTTIDTMLAPRALTAAELLSVATPHIVAYAVAHRAFIFAGTMSDGSMHEVATVHACEGALAGIVSDAVASVGEWLSDMDKDGEPRFYRKASVKDAIEKLCRAAAQIAVRLETAGELNDFLTDLTDRDMVVSANLINAAGEI